ncbi:MAG: DNA primase [Saprospiraceae bacterium]|nr:DNA primase [Saprospiraceae bacterium]
MINQETIQTIIETARVEEVIAEFVTLKKRGVNQIGLCPFHNEKTPSFTVSPAKGIYKCFGCGKAGNAVNFLMEHEHYSYPEALKYLAKKYNIEVEEEEQTPEQIQALNEKESLYHVSTFAANYFAENLKNKEEGKAIGLSYFKERGFSEETIEKFQLGYCIDSWDDFTAYALNNGYKLDYLATTGLTIKKDNKAYDRFRARVMFPIHNLSGRVIGFGGRTLSSDKTKPKYVNSPESEVYNKSKVLYGIYFAKNAILKKDNCFLVEGYTDVISLNQAGVENVVASSGTSLTTDQIRLIKRFTPNITMLFDGDPAGLKASFRGIDMILEEGMNVKIVLFPDGEDPDSYAKSHSSYELEKFITDTADNFILFKTNLLLKEASNDPVKKTSLIKEIVNTIAVIPDAISRTIYIRECGSLLNIKEQTLMNELNKILRNKFVKKHPAIQKDDLPDLTAPKQEQFIVDDASDVLEKFIVRLLLNFSHREIITEFNYTSNDKTKFKDNTEIERRNVCEFIVNDINHDKIEFKNPIYKFVFDEYTKSIASINESSPDENKLIRLKDKLIVNENQDIRKVVIELIISPYNLSENWIKLHDIHVPTEENEKILSNEVINTLYSFKSKFVEEKISDLREEVKNLGDDNYEFLMQQIRSLLEVKKAINDKLGRIVTK